MTSRAALRAVVGIGVSIVALWLVLQSVDPGRTADVLRSAAPTWIAVMAAFLVVDVLFRAVRWQRRQLLSRPRHRPVGLSANPRCLEAQPG